MQSVFTTAARTAMLCCSALSKESTSEFSRKTAASFTACIKASLYSPSVMSLSTTTLHIASPYLSNSTVSTISQTLAPCGVITVTISLVKLLSKNELSGALPSRRTKSAMFLPTTLPPI
jgi:hypothetical protein